MCGTTRPRIFQPTVLIVSFRADRLFPRWIISAAWNSIHCPRKVLGKCPNENQLLVAKWTLSCVYIVVWHQTVNFHRSQKSQSCTNNTHFLTIILRKGSKIMNIAQTYYFSTKHTQPKTNMLVRGSNILHLLAFFLAVRLRNFTQKWVTLVNRNEYLWSSILVNFNEFIWTNKKIIGATMNKFCEFNLGYYLLSFTPHEWSFVW